MTTTSSVIDKGKSGKHKPAVEQPTKFKKGAAIEVYGFVGWIASFICYITFCVWAFLPDSTLHYLGITYYSQKYWAIAAPVYFCVCIVYLIIVYLAVNLMNTSSTKSLDTIVDDIECVSTKPQLETASSIPPIQDIPIELVNYIMYQNCE